MEVYKPRLKAPAKNSAFYYSNKNLLHTKGYGMPNCTCYALGRYAEISGRWLKCYLNAERWYDTAVECGYPVSDTPMLGAIACWSVGNPTDGKDGAGHVAVVEKINARGDITCSNSAWNGTPFYMDVFKSCNKYNWTSMKTGKKYTFQGFILPPEKFIEQPRPLKITAAIQFREDPTNPRTKVGSVPKGAIFMYNGQYELVNNVKWLNGEYDGRTAWLSAIFTEEV